MLTGEGVKIIDFGIARVHKGTQSEDTEALGSFFTASPEHFGSAETDARSDVFSLGATLHDLLSGPDYTLEMPFKFPPIRTLNAAVSAEFEAVLQKATSFEPADRYQTMREMRAALGGARVTPPANPAPPPAAPTPVPRSRAPLAVLLLLVSLVFLGLTLFPRSSGETGHAHDTGFEGDVFGVRVEKNAAVVTLGEDVGLFRVRDGFGQTAEKRAEALAARLNKLYHEQCPTCGMYKLEPQGFRIARYVDRKAGLDEVALFYSHLDGNQYRAPLLLAILNREEASALGSTPRYAAGYWRDLTRDLIEISRGVNPPGSSLGRELSGELVAARRNMGDHPTIANLNALLAQIDAAKARRLESMFEKVPPSFKCQVDHFAAVGIFTPLKGLCPETW